MDVVYQIIYFLFASWFSIYTTPIVVGWFFAGGLARFNARSYPDGARRVGPATILWAVVLNAMLILSLLYPFLNNLSAATVTMGEFGSPIYRLAVGLLCLNISGFVSFNLHRYRLNKDPQKKSSN
jgi:hypothetical protein